MNNSRISAMCALQCYSSQKQSRTPLTCTVQSWLAPHSLTWKRSNRCSNSLLTSSLTRFSCCCVGRLTSSWMFASRLISLLLRWRRLIKLNILKSWQKNSWCAVKRKTEKPQELKRTKASVMIVHIVEPERVDVACNSQRAEKAQTVHVHKAQHQ